MYAIGLLCGKIVIHNKIKSISGLNILSEIHYKSIEINNTYDYHSFQCNA